ncbi:MAG: TonB-dependent receptor [Bacteroidota bacterium]
MHSIYHRILVLLCLLLCAGPSLFARFGQLKGRITDAQSGQALIGAYISLDSLQKGALSDESGYFYLHNLPEGEHQLYVSYLGYEKQKQVVQVIAGEEIAIEVALAESAIDLESVKISAASSSNPIRFIQALDLRLRPIRSSQEALRAVPGLIIAQHAGGGKAEQIFLRGFDIDHGTDLQIEVDGLPVNMVSHAHGQGYADLHFLIPETIGRIEVNKGPYEAADGNFATAGSIDFRTEDQLEDNLVKVEGGQFQRFRTLAMINLLDQEKHHAYLASEWVQTQGYFESPQDFQRLNLFGKYHGQLKDGQELSVSLTHFQSRWDASGQIPERAVAQGLISRFGAIDDTEGGETSRQSLNVQLRSPQAGGGVFEHQLGLIRYDFSLFSNFTFFLEDSLNGDQIWQHESRQIVFAQSRYHKSYSWAGLDGRTEIGGRLRADQMEDTELARTLNRETRLESLARGDIRENNLSIYAKQQVQLHSRLNVEVGLRYDFFQFRYEDALEPLYQPQSLDAGVLSTKFKLNFQALSNLQLYWQAGSGFHANDSRSLITQNPAGMLPQASGADLGLIFKPAPRLIIQSAAWILASEQEFVYVGDAGIVEASGASLRRGIDLSARWQVFRYLFAEGDFTYTHARFTEAEAVEQFVPLAPVLTASGALNYVRPTGFEASLRVRYLGDRPANEDYSLTAAGYCLLDGVVRYQIGKIGLGLMVENMLNAEWEEAQFETTSLLRGESEPVTEIHYTPGTPFQARLSVSYRF